MPDPSLLDPAFAPLVAAFSGPKAVSLADLGVEGARAAYRLLGSVDPDAPEPLVGEVVDAKIAGVACRTYWPLSNDRPAPVLVWFHGGGWIMGDVDMADATCRHLAGRSQWAVVSVEYRLAPEHRFPAGLEDAWAVTRAVAAGEVDGLDPARVVVGGDSAGGNLAAVCALLARDGGVSLAGQMLVYPSLDLCHESPSYVENGVGYVLTAAGIRWFIENYVGEVVRGDWRVSPLHAPDLTGLAPAWVLTVGFDPLRDEGEQYVARMQEAGVEVSWEQFPEAIHPFLDLKAISPLATVALDRAGDWLAAL